MDPAAWVAEIMLGASLSTLSLQRRQQVPKRLFVFFVFVTHPREHAGLSHQSIAALA